MDCDANIFFVMLDVRWNRTRCSSKSNTMNMRSARSQELSYPKIQASVSRQIDEIDDEGFHR